MQKLPLSRRVLRNAHRTLMQGVRGRNKSPGEYRKGPNWIGPEGCPIEIVAMSPQRWAIIGLPELREGAGDLHTGVPGTDSLRESSPGVQDARWAGLGRFQRHRKHVRDIDMHQVRFWIMKDGDGR